MWKIRRKYELGIEYIYFTQNHKNLIDDLQQQKYFTIKVSEQSKLLLSKIRIIGYKNNSNECTYLYLKGNCTL